MDLLGVSAVIVAVGGLITIITTSFLQIRASNRAVAAQAITALAVAKNTETLEVVHEQTNSNLAEVKAQLAAQTVKAEKVMDVSLESVTRQLEVAQAEINRLNAAASTR